MDTIIENRGAKKKYNISGLLVGKKMTFQNTTTGILLTCGKNYVALNDLGWHLRCFTEPDGSISIIRID